MTFTPSPVAAYLAAERAANDDSPTGEPMNEPVRCASCKLSGIAHGGWIQADGKWCCPSCQATPLPWVAPTAATVADPTDFGRIVHVRGCTLDRAHRGECSTRRSLASRPRSDDGEDFIVGGSGRRGGRGHE